MKRRKKFSMHQVLCIVGTGSSSISKKKKQQLLTSLAPQSGEGCAPVVGGGAHAAVSEGGGGGGGGSGGGSEWQRRQQKFCRDAVPPCAAPAAEKLRQAACMLVACRAKSLCEEARPVRASCCLLRWVSG